MKLKQPFCESCGGELILCCLNLEMICLNGDCFAFVGGAWNEYELPAASLKFIAAEINRLKREVFASDLLIAEMIDDMNYKTLTGKWKGELPIDGNQECTEETTSGG